MLHKPEARSRASTGNWEESCEGGRGPARVWYTVRVIGLVHASSRACSWKAQRPMACTVAAMSLASPAFTYLQHRIESKAPHHVAMGPCITSGHDARHDPEDGDQRTASHGVSAHTTLTLTWWQLIPSQGTRHEMAESLNARPTQ